MNQLQEHAVEAAVTKVTYAASGSAIILGMTANEFAAIGGIVVALLALVINALTTWYFKREHLKLARQAMKNGQRPERAEDE